MLAYLPSCSMVWFDVVCMMSLSVSVRPADPTVHWLNLILTWPTCTSVKKFAGPPQNSWKDFYYLKNTKDSCPKENKMKKNRPVIKNKIFSDCRKDALSCVVLEQITCTVHPTLLRWIRSCVLMCSEEVTLSLVAWIDTRMNSASL